MAFRPWSRRATGPEWAPRLTNAAFSKEERNLPRSATPEQAPGATPRASAAGARQPAVDSRTTPLGGIGAAGRAGRRRSDLPRRRPDVRAGERIRVAGIRVHRHGGRLGRAGEPIAGACVHLGRDGGRVRPAGFGFSGGRVRSWPAAPASRMPLSESRVPELGSPAPELASLTSELAAPTSVSASRAPVSALEAPRSASRASASGSCRRRTDRAPRCPQRRRRPADSAAGDRIDSSGKRIPRGGARIAASGADLAGAGDRIAPVAERIATDGVRIRLAGVRITGARLGTCLSPRHRAGALSPLEAGSLDRDGGPPACVLHWPVPPPEGSGCLS